MEDKKRVLVIFGGQSSEHEVSRISATSILKNINKEKFEVLMMGITKDGKWLLIMEILIKSLPVSGNKLL